MGYSLLEESRRFGVEIGDYPFNEIQITPGVVTTGYSWVQANPAPPKNTISREEAQKIADAKTDELPEMKATMQLIRDCAERGGYSIYRSTKTKENTLRAIASRLRSLGFSVEYTTYSDSSMQDSEQVVKITVSWY